MPLYVGNMAVSGSTRMQVTTVELLVAGAALEMAADIWLKKNLTAEEYSCLGTVSLTGDEYASEFERLSNDLRSGDALKGLARAVELEADTYNNNGLITYTTHNYLLDIMTDTTERQPTFTLPPFRKKGEEGPLSWAYVRSAVPRRCGVKKLFLRPVKVLIGL